MPETHRQRNKANCAASARRRWVFSFWLGCFYIGLAGLWLFVSSPSLLAQDALRYSLAGDAMAEAQRQQMMAPPVYTFKAGDFRLLAVPSVEMDYNDDINLSKIDTESDFILEPLLQLTGSYPVSQQNLFSLSVGVGYWDYLQHSSNSGLYLASSSQLSFDMFIKDFSINLHDQFSLEQDPGTEAAVAGTSEYGTFLNTAGTTVTWDLEDVVLTLGYDHQNSLATTGEFSYLNRFSELPLARAGFKFNPQLTAGLEGTAAFTTYSQAVLNDNQSYSAGLYADWKPGSFLEVEPRAGYTIYQFQHTSQSAQIFNYSLTGTPIIAPAGASIQTGDLGAWYADLTVSHEFSKVASYALSAGHEIRLGIQSDAVEDSYFRPNITWTIVKDLTLNTSFFYEHGNEGVGNIAGNLTETYDWYGGGLMLSYPLMKKLLLSLNYRLTARSSSLPSDEYAQNLVGIKLSYQSQ
jgi:hypothetical protein